MEPFEDTGLAAALPDALVEALLDGSAAEEGPLRVLLGAALAWTALVFVVRTGWRLLRGFGRLVSMRRDVLEVGGLLSTLRTISAWAVLGLAWLPVYHALDSGHVSLDLQRAAVLPGLLWLLLRALDHGVVWRSRTEPKLVVQSGHGLGRVTRTEIDLREALRDATTGERIDDPARARRGTRVTVERRAQQIIRRVLRSDDVANAWTAQALRAHGLVLTHQARG